MPPPIRVSTASTPMTDRFVLDVGCVVLRAERRLNAAEDLQAPARCDSQGVLPAIEILASAFQNLEAATAAPTVSVAVQLDHGISEEISRLVIAVGRGCGATFVREQAVRFSRLNARSIDATVRYHSRRGVAAPGIGI